jgi:hypothetical protein
VDGDLILQEAAANGKEAVVDKLVLAVKPVSIGRNIPTARIDPSTGMWQWLANKKRKIATSPSMRRPVRVNLLHSRFSLSVAFQARFPMGAYSIPSETGLLILSVSGSYQLGVKRFSQCGTNSMPPVSQAIMSFSASFGEVRSVTMPLLEAASSMSCKRSVLWTCLSPFTRTSTCKCACMDEATLARSETARKPRGIETCCRLHWRLHS